MNAQTHRLIFNKARGCIMAVSETASTCRKSACGTTPARRSQRKGCRTEVDASNKPPAHIQPAQIAMNSVVAGNLSPSIALTATQMAQLTSDIVWLVERDVSLTLIGGSLSASKSNIDSNFQSVTEQTAIRAGDGGFAVNVQGNTDLKGAVITSTQAAVDNNKNTFTTGGTLTLSDLQNSANYNANAAGISMSVGQQDGKYGVSGVGAGIGSDKGNASSTTTAGISGIAGNTAVRTGDAQTGLQPIFDAGKVQREIDAQVTITQTFSREAPKAVATFSANTIADLKKDLAQETDPGKRAAITSEIANWGEGGTYRIALHTAAGALSGGISGAAGAAVSASAANLMNDLQDSLQQGLQTAGLSDAAAKAVAQGVAGLTAAGVGAAVGGAQGAATALTVDANNRQLHPTEVQRIKELANGDPRKQARLTEAACALVRCADGVPKDDPNYAYLKAMQDAGANLQDEQKILLAQQSRPGDPTRTFGPLFRYTGVDQYLIDPATQNKLGTRLAGAVQAGAGLAGVVSSGALCTTGVGCVAGALTGTVSVDYAQAGAQQTLTGNSATPYGEQVLQSLGLSPQAAAITYGVLGVTPAAVESVLLNKAVNVQAAANAAAKLSYEPIQKFGAQGVKVTPEVMQTPQAKALVAEYQAAGNPVGDAERYARGILQTGSNLPVIRTAAANEELIKVVPKSALADDGVSKFSPYFMTRAEYDALSKLNPAEIGQKLGLPAEQGVRGTQLGFEAYSITPKPGATPKVFTSTVAPVEQGVYNAVGGAQQTIVPNRSLWTEPKSIGSIGGAK